MKARILIILMTICSLSLLHEITLAQGRGGDFRPGNSIDGQDTEGQRGLRTQQRGPREGESGPEGEWPNFGPGGMGPYMGMGPEGGMAGPRGGRGMFGMALTTEELLEFLKEHDPIKAGQFNEMYEKQPEQFKEYIGIICELYTPAARLMEYDKEAGELAVKNISLSLDVKKQVAEYKASNDQTVKRLIKSELTKSLEKQFDVIVDSQQKEIDIWKDRFSRFANNRPDWNDSAPVQQQPNMVGPGGPGRSGLGGGPGGRGGRNDRGEEMQQRMKEQFEKRQQDIDKWKKQKKQIVERKLIDLVEDVRPFPWTN